MSEQAVSGSVGFSTAATHIGFIRKIVPEISGVPLYLLRSDEAATDWEPHWLAIFSPLGDLKSQSILESLGLWAGRGINIVVRSDCESWSPCCRNGALLHKSAHGLEHLADPAALTTELTPLEREMLTVGESKLLSDAGICRNDLIRGQHAQNFVRLCCHLHRSSVI